MTNQRQTGRDDQRSEQYLRRRTADEKINDGRNKHQDGQLHGMEDSVERDHSCQPAASA